MTSRWKPRFVALVIALALFNAAAARSRDRGPLVLFTADDAQHLRLTDEEWQHSHRTRAATSAGGPRVIVENPQLKQTSEGPMIETTTPASLVVVFEPSVAPVDMASLQVTARKGFFSKSLTDLLKPYVHGSALQVKDVAIPEGKFLIEITITDRGGAKTVETYRLHVQQP